MAETKEKFGAVVIDANAIIKGAGLSRLLPAADSFFTVPGVLTEIVDRKARAHLESLPFEVVQREPSANSCRIVSEFSRKTGDYRELSVVDIQVLALQYELDVEGCGGSSHLRSEPKRKLGLGKIEPLNPNDTSLKLSKSTNTNGVLPQSNGKKEGDSYVPQSTAESGMYEVQIDEVVIEEDDLNCVEENDEKKDDELLENTSDGHESVTCCDEVKATVPIPPKSWAAVVNPTKSTNATSAAKLTESNVDEVKVIDPKEILDQYFGSMKISGKTSTTKQKPNKKYSDDDELGGQFSDADEDDEDNDSLQFAGSDADISDEECDVYILDPEEVEARKNGMDTWSQGTNFSVNVEPQRIASGGSDSITDGIFHPSMADDLSSDFPSMAAANNVPYKESEERDEAGPWHKAPPKHGTKCVSFAESLNATKQASLEPIGKRWDSFRKEKHIVTPKGVVQLDEKETLIEREKERMIKLQEYLSSRSNNDDKKERPNPNSSRIIGGMDIAGQSEDVFDDGEGWVTTGNIESLKMNGLAGFTSFACNKKLENEMKKDEKEGPHILDRCACATTDFAMQNVILQMGMKLLSIDGITVKRIKHWVTRCSTCYTVYGGESKMKLGGRLFCDKCGGSYLERVSASVDANTGRYKLYLNRRKKVNKRGTKFSLPKPGKGNRFEGDILLREDQLMMGAWNQKVKKGNKSLESMFGSDIASHVGLGDLTKRKDIAVGFGRRNPNSAKGRERRGKKNQKKKNKDKACGLRRY